MTYYAGVAIVALPGLIGVILLGRLHKVALNHCQRLEDEIARAEGATDRIRSLLSDVGATMNLSLALSRESDGGLPREDREALRAAVHEAVCGEQHGRSTASNSSMDASAAR
jgi:hypothetical protein